MGTDGGLIIADDIQLLEEPPPALIEEETILRVAHQYEQKTKFYERKPNI